VAAKPKIPLKMMNTNKFIPSRREALLPGGIGPHWTAIEGGLTLGVASASPNSNERVPSMALSSGITTAETVVSSGTQWNQNPDGDSESAGVSQASDALSTICAKCQDSSNATSKL